MSPLLAASDELIGRAVEHGPALDGLMILLDVSLKGGALLAIAWAINGVARRRTAAMRYVLWTTALVGLLILPMLSGILPSTSVSWWPSLGGDPEPRAASLTVATPERATPRPLTARMDPRAERTAAVEESANALPATHETPPGRAAPAQLSIPVSTPISIPEPSSASVVSTRETATWPRWILGVWLAGTACGIGWLGLGLARARSCGRRASPLDDPSWRGLRRSLRSRLDLKTDVRLLRSDEIATPMTWGWRTPVILLPAASDHWSEERRRVVLLHEMVHVRRRDWLIQIMGQLVRAAHWYHPLVWSAVRRLAIERELSCDERVVALGTKPSAYARHLLEVASTRATGSIPMSGALAMANRTQLEGRLMSILDPTPKRRHGLVLSLSLVATLLVTAVSLATIRAEGDPPKRERDHARHRDDGSHARLHRHEDPPKRERDHARHRDDDRSHGRRHEHDHDDAPEADSRRVHRFHKKIARLLERLHGHHREIAPHEEAIERLHERMRPLRRKPERLHERMEPHEHAMDPFEEHLEPFERALEETHERMRPLERELERLHERMEPFDEEMEELHDRLEPFHEQMERLHEHMDPMHRRLEKFEKRLRPLHEKIERIHEHLGPLHERLHELDELDEKEIAREIRKALKPFMKELGRLEDQIEPFHHDIEHLHEDLFESPDGERGSFHEEMEHLHSKMEPFHEHLEHLHENMQPWHEAMEPIHEALEPFHLEMEELMERMEPIHREMERTHEEAMEPFLSELEHLHESMEPFHREMEPVHEEIEELHRRLEPLREEITEHLRKELRDLIKDHLDEEDLPKAIRRRARDLSKAAPWGWSHDDEGRSVNVEVDTRKMARALEEAIESICESTEVDLDRDDRERLENAIERIVSEFGRWKFEPDEPDRESTLR